MSSTPYKISCMLAANIELLGEKFGTHLQYEGASDIFLVEKHQLIRTNSVR